MLKTVKKQLIEVFNNPTAPYREGWVQFYVKSELKRLNVPHFQDRWGNIFAGVSNATSLKSSSRTALVAHMDHPGFHILKKKTKNIYFAQWHGGFPRKSIGSKLAIYCPKFPGVKSLGRVTKEIDKKGFFELRVTKENFQIHSTCFGAFDFPGSKFHHSIVHTRVADDLTGVVIILSTLSRLNKKEKKKFLGIFTTAEETGFKGALGLLDDKTLGPNNFSISLEASRQMPEAIIGQGPVIRLGDKRSIFDNGITFKLEAAATELFKKTKMKYQKRIMSGGTCEATAFNVFKIPCGGIAVPLGNYHNQKNNGRPGPEYVDLRDVENAVALCVRFYQNEAKGFNPVAKYSQLLIREFKKSKKYFDKAFRQ